LERYGYLPSVPPLPPLPPLPSLPSLPSPHLILPSPNLFCSFQFGQVYIAHEADKYETETIPVVPQDNNSLQVSHLDFRFSLFAFRFSLFAVRFSLLASRVSRLASRLSLLDFRFSLFASRFVFPLFAFLHLTRVRYLKLKQIM